MRRLVLLALGAFAVFANGCRCNAVDENELPAATAAPTPPSAAAPAQANSGARPAAATVIDCGPDIGGLDLVQNAPLVLLGELHGLRAAPIFTLDLACRLALSDTTKTVTLALEIPDAEQPRFEAFLASPGRDADRRALLAGVFWTGTKDGRSSGARLDMLEQTRSLAQRGVKLRVLTIDSGAANRDEHMAKRVIAAVEEKLGPVLVLAGNMHTRLAGDGKGHRWMGEYVKEKLPNTLSFDNRYGEGDAWICTGTCGVQKVIGQDPTTDTKWRLERFTAPDDKGYSGAWHLGPAKASPPVVEQK